MNSSSLKRELLVSLNMVMEATKFKIIEPSYCITFISRILSQLEENTGENRLNKLNFLLSIIENLGRVSYYNSLELHLAMNRCFERLKKMIDTNIYSFEKEVIFRINGLHNFLKDKSIVNDKKYFEKESKEWRGIANFSSKQ